jgi:polyhydroxybutyrate depolymerase
MKTALAVAPLLGSLLLCLLCACTPTDDGVTQGEFSHNGTDRSYLYYAPDQLSADAPLVVVLHGFTSSAENIMNYSGLNTLARENGFAVAYPQGSTDQEGKTFWNVGYDFHAGITTDDVDYIVQLVRDLQDRYSLSAENTFLTGMSNGGDLCYLMACRQPEVFRAIAPVCGTMMQSYFSDCLAEKAPPMLTISSTADEITRYQGDPENKDGWGAYVSVPAIIDYWASAIPNGSLQTDTLPDREPSDGSYVVREHYTGQVAGKELIFYRVVNGGHDWPGAWGNQDIRASEEIWAFFARYRTSNS